MKMFLGVLSFCVLMFGLFSSGGADGHAEECGTVWHQLKLPDAAAKSALRGVFFLNDKTGWVVGDKGLCLTTKDGGDTWDPVKTGSGATLRCVRFHDTDTGFICGDGDPGAPKPSGDVHIVLGHPKLSGTLLSTTDGGKSWQTRWIPTNFEIHAVEVGTAPEIQVAISGVPDHLDGDITRSSDAGKKWSSYPCYRALMDVRTIEEDRWVAVGTPVKLGFLPIPKDETYKNKPCRALYSKDAGKSWSVAKGSDGRATLHGLAAKAGAPVVACGEDGTILRSEDKGENWSAMDSGTKEDLFAAAWASGTADALVAVGGKGTIRVSSDSGKTWKPSASPTSVTLLSVSAAADSMVVAGIDGTLLRASVKELLSAERQEH